MAGFWNRSWILKTHINLKKISFGGFLTKMHDLPKGGRSAVELWIIMRSSSKRGRQVWWGSTENVSSLLALWQRNSSDHVVQLFAFLRPGTPCLTPSWVAGALEWGIWLRGCCKARDSHLPCHVVLRIRLLPPGLLLRSSHNNPQHSLDPEWAMNS